MFDTFPNKDQLHEINPESSNDYNLKLYGRNLMVEGKVYSMSHFQKQVKMFSKDQLIQGKPKKGRW